MFILGDARGNFVNMDPTKKPPIFVSDSSALTSDTGCLKYWKRVELEERPSWYSYDNLFGKWPLPTPPELFTLLHVVEGKYLQIPVGAPSYLSWQAQLVGSQAQATVFISMASVRAVVDHQSSSPGYSLYSSQLDAFPNDMAFIFDVTSQSDPANARAQLAIMTFNMEINVVDTTQPHPKGGKCPDGDSTPKTPKLFCVTKQTWPLSALGTYGNGCQCPSSKSHVDADASSSTCAAIPDEISDFRGCQCGTTAGGAAGVNGPWWTLCSGGIVWGAINSEADGQKRAPVIVYPPQAAFPRPYALPAAGCTVPPSILPTPPSGGSSAHSPNASAEHTKKVVRTIMYAVAGFAGLVLLSGLGITVWHHMAAKSLASSASPTTNGAG